MKAARMPARVAVAATGLSLAVLLAGCGGDDPKPAAPASAAATTTTTPPGLESKPAVEIRRMAVAAMRKAGTGRFAGTDKGSPNGAMSLDMLADDKGGTGTITMKGAKIQVITIGNRTWFKTDDRGWAAIGMPAQIRKGLAGHWVDLGKQKMAAGEQANFSSMISLIEKYPALKPKATRSKLGDRDVVILSYADGSKMWVAATGPAYVLRADVKTPTKGSLTFSDFGKKIDVKAPEDAITL